MELDLQHLPKWRLASVRHVGPYNEIGSAFEKLAQWAAPKGLLKPGAAMLGVYWDDPQKVAPADCRSDASLILSEDDPAPEADSGVVEQILPGGDYALFLCYLYDMSRFAGMWQRVFMEGLPQARRQYDPERPCFELYYTCPEMGPLRKAIFDICVPVLPAE